MEFVIAPAIASIFEIKSRNSSSQDPGSSIRLSVCQSKLTKIGNKKSIMIWIVIISVISVPLDGIFLLF